MKLLTKALLTSLLHEKPPLAIPECEQLWKLGLMRCVGDSKFVFDEPITLLFAANLIGKKYPSLSIFADTLKEGYIPWFLSQDSTKMCFPPYFVEFEDGRHGKALIDAAMEEPELKEMAIQLGAVFK